MTKKGPTLIDLERLAREVGHELAPRIPASRGYGFALFVFNLGKRGHMTYVSNANRDDMILAIEETLAHLKTGAIAPPGMPNHPANKQGKG